MTHQSLFYRYIILPSLVANGVHLLLNLYKTMNKTRGMQFWKAAMRYYPDFSRSTAVRRFREEIHNTPELLEELKRLGYDEHRRYFPPGQMAVIIKYLGD